MSDGLGLPNDKLSYEENLEILKNNGIEVSKKLLNTGVTILREKISKVAQVVSSTSYVALSEFQVAIKSSGGVTAIFFNPFVTASTNTADIQVKIDDVEARVGAFGAAAAVNEAWCFVIFKKLTKGNHTVKIFAKVDGASVTIGSTTRDSALYILEFNNGG